MIDREIAAYDDLFTNVWNPPDKTPLPPPPPWHDTHLEIDVPAPFSEKVLDQLDINDGFAYRLSWTGWEEKRAKDGRVYYVNHETRETTWTRPTAPASTAPPCQFL